MIVTPALDELMERGQSGEIVTTRNDGEGVVPVGRAARLGTVASTSSVSSGSCCSERRQAPRRSPCWTRSPGRGSSSSARSTAPTTPTSRSAAPSRTCSTPSSAPASHESDSWGPSTTRLAPNPSLHGLHSSTQPLSPGSPNDCCTHPSSPLPPQAASDQPGGTASGAPARAPLLGRGVAIEGREDGGSHSRWRGAAGGRRAEPRGVPQRLQPLHTALRWAA